MIKSKVLFLTFLFFICSCSSKYSKPEDTCLYVWKALFYLDMETVKELSTEDSYFSLTVLEVFLKQNGFYYFRRNFGFEEAIESEAMSAYFNKD